MSGNPDARDELGSGPGRQEQEPPAGASITPPTGTGRPRRTEAAFDAELRRVARAMVAEDLPREILDPSLSPDGPLAGRVRTRRALPGFAAAATSLVVLLLASAVALAPGSPDPSLETPPGTQTLGMEFSPKPTKAPVLRGTGQIGTDLGVLGYECNDGPRIESPLPGADAVVKDALICEGPRSAGPFTTVVVVGEAADGRVTLVHIKAEIVGEDTPAARDAVSQAVARAAAVITVDKGGGSVVSSWVAAKMPTLEAREGVEIELAGLFLRINRSTSGYYLFNAEPG